MSARSIESRFLKKLGGEWEAATPGLVVQAYLSGRKIIDLEIGQTYPIYDWASLTKIVFSATALMFLHDEKRVRVNDPIAKWIDWFPKESRLRLRDLLSHSAGLTWWYPFYEPLSVQTTSKTTPEEAWEIFGQILKRKILNDLPKQTDEPKKAVYSDLDLFMLGIAMEKIAQASLYDLWSSTRERMGLNETNFLRANRAPLAKTKYAPTEHDANWRKMSLQGVVHDENTYALKGVAPHAGLFGPISDLSRFGLLLRKAMRGEKTRGYASPETVRLFTKRSIPRAQGDWALGFMMPTKGSASCGRHFSLQSVGHTGFTGTSLWYDPKKDLLVTILSNRVYPTRENKAFLPLRPKMHDLICESLKER